MGIAKALELGFRDQGAGVRVRGKGLRMVWRLGWKKAPTELCRAQKVLASGYKAPIYGIHKWIYMDSRGPGDDENVLGVMIWGVVRQDHCWAQGSSCVGLPS